MDYPGLKQMHVLFVEDEPGVRASLRNLLDEHVKGLECAEDGETGLKLFEAERPDLVITDIRMPNKNGLDMAEEIRKSDEDVTIVLMTAFDDPHIMKRAINIGIDAFMSKPVNPEKMLELLEKRARQVQVRHELRKSEKLLHEYKHAVDAGALVSKTDPNGCITYANDEFCAISGYTREELVGNPHNIVRHPDMPKEAFADMWQTIQAQQVWQGKVKNRRKDGSAYYVQATIVPVVDENGETVEYIGLRQDITELELLNQNLEARVNEEVQKNREKDKEMIDSLSKLLDASPNPIIVYQDGNVRFVNEKFLYVSALQADALQGEAFDLGTLFEVRPGHVASVEEIDYASDTNKVSIASANGRNIFHVMANHIDLANGDAFEMFTFNNITLSEYQKLKISHYNSRLEDFIKGMGKRLEEKAHPVAEETVAPDQPAKATVVEEAPVVVPETLEAVPPEPKIVPDEPAPEGKKGRKLDQSEREVLKRSRMNAEISSAEYAAEIDDYILTEIQELNELETEINDVLTIFEESKGVQQLYDIAGKLAKYASIIGLLFEFEDLAFSIDSLGKVLVEVDETALDDLKVRKIELFLSNILLDLSNWRRTIFVEQSANDIHYLDASLFSAILQLELVLNEADEIDDDDDDDDFELF